MAVETLTGILARKKVPELLKQAAQAGAKTIGTPTASPPPLLPIAITDPAMGLFVASRYPKLQKSRSRSTRVDQLRFEAGLKDGRLLKFRKGLNRGGSRQRLLGEY